jgi:hypothetical protein
LQDDILNRTKLLKIKSFSLRCILTVLFEVPIPEGINKCLPNCAHLFYDLDEMQCIRFAYNAVQFLWVLGNRRRADGTLGTSHRLQNPDTLANKTANDVFRHLLHRHFQKVFNV